MVMIIFNDILGSLFFDHKKKPITDVPKKVLSPSNNRALCK